MPAHVVTVSSRSTGAGKTLIAAALCRWYRREHLPVCPFVLRSGAPPEPRMLEVLARAAELVERWAPTGSPAELAAECANWDYVVVECASGAEPPAAARFELLNEGGEALAIYDPASGTTFRAEWYQAEEIFPGVPADVAALPEWSFSNAPRVGIVSLPHLRNFADFRLFRAAEWITFPPPGDFALLLMPASSDASFDREWLKETGVGAWLEQQRTRGCRVLGIGESMGEATRLDEGTLQDFRAASRILGRRLPPPEPGDAALDALAAWLASVVGAAMLRTRCLGHGGEGVE
jgi:hypothetical protein